MVRRQEAAEALCAQLGFDPAAEGFELAPGEADALLQVAEALSAPVVPEADPAVTDRLIASLQQGMRPASHAAFRAELEAAWSGAAWWRSGPGRGGRSEAIAAWLAHGLAAVQPQVRVLRTPFWLASAAVVAAGLPLVLPSLQQALGLAFGLGGFLVAVAPVLATLGVAYAFRSAGTGMAEVEAACPLTPAQLLLGRLFWVAAYDAALLGAASLVAAGVDPGVNLGYLVLGWLAPLLLGAAGALALTLYVPVWIGAAGVLTLWTASLIIGLEQPTWFLPGLAGTHAVLWPALLLGAAAVAAVAGIIATAPRLAARLTGEEGG